MKPAPSWERAKGIASRETGEVSVDNVHQTPATNPSLQAASPPTASLPVTPAQQPRH